MSDLIECMVDGGTWVVGDLVVNRQQFEEMTAQEDGTFTAVLKHDGFAYFYDGLVADIDLSHGIKNMTVTFRLTPANIFAKGPA